MQTGFKFARKYGYDIAVQFDGDGQHKAIEINKLIDIIKSGSCNMVMDPVSALKTVLTKIPSYQGNRH